MVQWLGEQTDWGTANLLPPLPPALVGSTQSADIQGHREARCRKLARAQVHTRLGVDW